MISFAVAVGLWLGAKSLVEPALDRALCEPRPSLPAGKANAPTVEGLLRLDEPRIQECLLAAQYDGASAVELTVRVQGGAQARFELVGDLDAKAHACVETELHALLNVTTLAAGDKAEVHFRRSPFRIAGVHAKLCLDPAHASSSTCQVERTALKLGERLRRMAPGWCDCFAQSASTPAAIGLGIEMRGKRQPVSVKAAEGDAAGACLAHEIESRQFDGVEGSSFNLPLVFSMIDSRASAVAEPAPVELKRAQTTAIVEHAQSEVLLAAGRRQAAFERLDSGVHDYDQHRARASAQDAAAPVKQNAAALGPIHADCLALVKADTELLGTVDASLGWLRKGLELTRSAGAKPDVWKRELAHQTAYRTTVDQERTKHSTGCDEIDRASRDGLAITWQKPTPAPKPSSDELLQDDTKDMQGEQ